MSGGSDLSVTFDVIIAGAGPAGCVLASRLSENADKRVLLIEAGPDSAAPGIEHPDVVDPFCLLASYNSTLHWPGLRAHLAASSGDESSSPYIQGFGVGGASNINGMGADRGLPADYDEWRDLGARGWGWDDVLPYFRKLERDLDFPSHGSMHGDSGPMPVRRLPRARWAPFAVALADAMQHHGFSFIDDYMSDFREGFAAVPTNCLPERRVSAAMAYLTRDVRQRSNLVILPDTKVARVSLAGKRADGVFIEQHGSTTHVRGREVILTCGAIQSPAVLMRSGIGPGQRLARHGIGVLHDLGGLGANLQNHPSLSLTTYLDRKAQQPLDNPWLLQNWLRFSSGHPRCAPNDMHLMAFSRCAWHALGPRTGAIAISVLKSYSTGYVDLTDADAAAAPRVQFNSVPDPRDEERLVSGVRLALMLLSDPAVTAVRHELIAPNRRLVAALSRRSKWNRFRARAIVRLLDIGPLRRLLLARSRIDAETLLADEKSLREFVRANATLQFHLCGTCRMGPAHDERSVVDEAGRVHGIEALRVADASIFPTIPSGYVHFIVLMAAEKLADAVKTDWQTSVRPRSGEMSRTKSTLQTDAVR